MRFAWLAGSLAGLLGLLGYFKYYGFFAVNVDNVLSNVGMGHLIPLFNPTLPIAISFFTFMAVSYVVDVYRGTLPLATPIDLARLYAPNPKVQVAVLKVIAREQGFYNPLPIQFLTYVENVFTGNFGTDLIYGNPEWDDIARERLLQVLPSRCRCRRAIT